VYDGSDTATATLNLHDLVGGETLAVSNAATFNSKDVGSGTVVTVNSVQLADGSNGGKASNYSLSLGSIGHAAASILPKTLTVSANALDKTYDGTRIANATVSLNGLVGSELLGTSVGATFNSKDVLGANTVTVNSLSLSNGGNGGLASNYSVTPGQTVTAHITPQALSATLMAADNKTYDSTTVATGNLNVTGLVAGEGLTVTHQESFADKNVGVGKTVTVTGIQLADGVGGGKASNYTVQAGQTATANIAAKTVSVQYEGVDKMYDGTNTATVVGVSSGVYRSDDVRFTNNPTTYADSMPGLGKPIQVSGIALAGADAGNYILGGQTSTTAYGSIILPTGCAGVCGSQTVTQTPVGAPILGSASVTPLVSGASAAAIKRSSNLNEGAFQVPAAVKPVASSVSVSATPLEPALSVTNVSQVRSLSADQVASLAPAKLAELMPALTPKQLMAVTPDQMAGLDATQLNQLVILMDSALSKMKR
jgi:hypothetical protein